MTDSSNSVALLTRGWALFRRRFWGATAVLVVLNLAAAAVTVVAVTAVSELAWAQRADIFADGTITDRGILTLVAQVGVPAGLVLALVSAAGFVALAAWLGARSLSTGLNIGGALRRGLTRALPFVGAFALAALEVLLALLLAPVISAAGIVLLAFFGVRALLSRRRGGPAERSFWLSWPLLIAYAVPFGLALVILVHSILILPVAAHERRGPLEILRRSSELARGASVRVGVVGILALVLYTLVVAGVSALGLIGVPALWVTVVLFLAQFTVAALPVAILVALYVAQTGGRVPTGAALPHRNTSRRAVIAGAASGATAALVLGILVPVGIPTPAWAAEDPAVFATSDGDEDGPPEDAGMSEDAGEEVPGEPGDIELYSADGVEGDGDEEIPAPAWWDEARLADDGVGRKFGSPAFFNILPHWVDDDGHLQDKPTLGMAVDSLGDESDAAPGDGWCETSAGSCTLRAAMEELSVWRAGHANIYPADAAIANGTILLNSPLVATTRFLLQGERDHNWESLGARLTIDGQNLHQIFRITTGSGGGADLYGLVLRNGYAPSGAQGGAVQVLDGSVNLTNVLLEGNDAADEGAASAVYAPGSGSPGLIDVSSSSLRNNPVPACYALGFSAGSTTIDQVDESCPGTTTVAGAVATTVDMHGTLPDKPKKGGEVTYRAVVKKVQEGEGELSGTITFHVEGRDPIVVAVPADGVVSASGVAPSADEYTVRAVYSGSDSYRGSEAETTVVTDRADSRVALSYDSDSGMNWYRGHPIILTATVASNAAGLAPTGEVTFSHMGQKLGTATIDADGRAVLATTITADDGYNRNDAYWWDIAAAYAGDSDHEASIGAASLQLEADNTTVTITPSTANASPGDAVTFTVRVTTLGLRTVPVTMGTVDIEAGTMSESFTVDAAGEASFTVENIGFGSLDVTARYEGARGLLVGSYSALSYSVTSTVASTVNFARSGGSTSLIGEDLSFVVSVKADSTAGGLPAPTGTVRLVKNGTVLATGTLTRLDVSDLPVGVHDMSIEYSGDGVYRPSSVAVQHTVQQMPTSISFTRSPQTSVIGQPVEFTVAVRTDWRGQSDTVTEGKVHVLFDGSLVGTIDLAEGNTLRAPLPWIVGEKLIEAQYEGTDYYASSSPSTFAYHTQSKATAAVELELAQNEVPYAGTVEATVRVTGVAPSTERPQWGTVQLLNNDGTPLPGTTAVNLSGDGTAAFNVSAARIGAGTHRVYARFSGNEGFNDRSSATVELTVPRHVPSLDLTINGATGGAVVWGQPVELQAIVEIPWVPDPFSGAEDPLGTVDFVLVNGYFETTLGSVYLNEQFRRASLTVPRDELPPGEHEIVARFSPSAETIGRLDFARTDSQLLQVSAVPVEIVIEGLNAVLPGENFVRMLRVRENPDFAIHATPTGTVTIAVDGGAPQTHMLAPLMNNGLPMSIGYANVFFAALTPGPHTVTVEYLPATGSTHAATTVAVDFTAGRVDPEITLNAESRSVLFDTSLRFTASVKAPFSDYPQPRGTIVITDGELDGASCEFTVVSSSDPLANSCALSWPEAGSHLVHAVFVPAATEQTYGETTSLYPLAITVLGREPGFTFSARAADGSGSQPTAGDTVRVQWGLSGTATRTPTGGVTLAVTPSNAVPAGALAACNTKVVSGSCDVALTIAGAAAAQVTFTGSYAGDTRFLATTRTAALSPRDCVVLRLEVVPEGAGTLTPQQTPNCGEPGQPKTGFSEFTVVTFEAAPLPSSDPSFDWVLKDIESAQGTGNGFPVSPAADWARATFVESYQCVMVTIDVTNATAEEMLGELRLPSGSSSGAPNCIQDDTKPEAQRYQRGIGAWTSPQSFVSSTQNHTALYLRGSEPAGFRMNLLTPDAKVYAFESAGFARDGERVFAAQPLRESTHLGVIFGPTCYPATAEAIGPGTLTIQNPQNCAEPAAGSRGGDGTGAEGWFAGTELRLHAVPSDTSGDTIGYVKTWAGTDRYPDTSTAMYETATVFDVNIAAQVETVTVRASEPAPHVTAEFTACHAVTIHRGRITTGEWMPEMPFFSGSTECGHPLAEEFIARAPLTAASDTARRYVAEGTDVAFEAQLWQELTDVFVGANSVKMPSYPVPLIGWQRDDALDGVADPWPAEMASAEQGAQQLTVSEPANFIPQYEAPAACETTARVWTSDSSRLLVSTTLNNVKENCATGNLGGETGTFLSGQLPGRGKFATHDDIDRASDSSITLIAEVAEGLDPIVGWEMRAGVSDPRVAPEHALGSAPSTDYARFVTLAQPVVGRQITMPLGFDSLYAEAVICQQLDYSVNVTREDGQVIRNFDNGDELLMAYPAPDCPIAPNAWKVGTEVELWAFGNPAGYRFTGWEGDVEGGDAGVVHAENTGLAELLGEGIDEFLGAGFPANAVTIVQMDGTAPTKRVDAHYEVQCFDVTVFSKKVESNTDIAPPNCPGFEGKTTLISNITGQPYDVQQAKKDDSVTGGLIYRAGAKEMTGRYIGGTEIVAVADTDWSDQVWLGWREDVVDASKDGGRFNPATILAGAGSKAGGDSYVINRYRDRTTEEEFEKIGNDIAIGMKKGLGFASIVFTDYVVNYPPVGTVFMVSEGMSMVNSLLDMAGVPGDYISWMAYPKQITDLMKAPLSCIGNWALGASGREAASDLMGSTSDVVSGAASRAKAVTDAAAKVATQKAAITAGNTGVFASAKLGYYQGKLGLAQLKKVTGPVTSLASAGMAVYNVVDDGLAWDKSAKDAWTSFDAYTDCVKATVPSFLKGSKEAEEAILDYAEKMRSELVGDHDFARLTAYVVDDDAVAARPQLDAEAMAVICETNPYAEGCWG